MSPLMQWLFFAWAYVSETVILDRKRIGREGTLREELESEVHYG